MVVISVVSLWQLAASMVHASNQLLKGHELRHEMKGVTVETIEVVDEHEPGLRLVE